MINNKTSFIFVYEIGCVFSKFYLIGFTKFDYELKIRSKMRLRLRIERCELKITQVKDLNVCAFSINKIFNPIVDAIK